jgi:photosystem II stability/assembly factor-like uncharacterized protein
VFGTCSGSGSDYVTACTSFSLWTSVPGTRTWSQISLPAPYSELTSASSAAPLLVIAGGSPPTAYLLAPSGEMLSAPVAGGSWKALGAARCKPGSPSASGRQEQSFAQLAAGPELVLACDTPTTSGGFTAAIYTSADGATWKRAGSVAVKGTPTSLTSAASGQVVLATTDGIEYSADSGKSWQAARFTGAAPAEGFSYVGMTTRDLGVAVPEDLNLGEVYVTSDGGKIWQPSPITG